MLLPLYSFELIAELKRVNSRNIARISKTRTATKEGAKLPLVRPSDNLPQREATPHVWQSDAKHRGVYLIKGLMQIVNISPNWQAH